MRTVDKQMLIGAAILALIVLFGVQWQRHTQTAALNACIGQAYLNGEKMEGIADRCGD